MSETPREVFAALLADLLDHDYRHDGMPNGFERWHVEWLARFDAAMPLELKPVKVDAREAAFMAAREEMRDAIARHIAGQKTEPEPLRERTWEDVRDAAFNDADLHAAVYMVERCGVSKEQALLAAALSLSRSRTKLQQEAVNLLANRPAFAPPRT